MKTKPNSHIKVAPFNRKPSELDAMRAKKRGNPKHAPLGQRAIKARSSLTSVGDNANIKNSLAICIADVFDEVQALTNRMPIRRLRLRLV